MFRTAGSQCVAKPRENAMRSLPMPTDAVFRVLRASTASAGICGTMGQGATGHRMKHPFTPTQELR
jgi:hypothetical protein